MISHSGNYRSCISEVKGWKGIKVLVCTKFCNIHVNSVDIMSIGYRQIIMGKSVKKKRK